MFCLSLGSRRTIVLLYLFVTPIVSYRLGTKKAPFMGPIIRFLSFWFYASQKQLVFRICMGEF